MATFQNDLTLKWWRKITLGYCRMIVYTQNISFIFDCHIKCSSIVRSPEWLYILVPWLVDKHLIKVMTFLQQMLDSQTVNRLLAPVALAWLPPWNWPWISKKLRYIASIYIYAAFPYRYRIQTLVFGGSKAETSGFQHCLFPLQILFPFFHAFVSQHFASGALIHL